jgi:hypothetical protein
MRIPDQIYGNKNCFRRYLGAEDVANEHSGGLRGSDPLPGLQRSQKAEGHQPQAEKIWAMREAVVSASGAFLTTRSDLALDTRGTKSFYLL